MSRPTAADLLETPALCSPAPTYASSASNAAPSTPSSVRSRSLRSPVTPVRSFVPATTARSSTQARTPTIG
jgi:hypothetical protein